MHGWMDAWMHACMDACMHYLCGIWAMEQVPADLLFCHVTLIPLCLFVAWSQYLHASICTMLQIISAIWYCKVIYKHEQWKKLSIMS